MGFNPSKEVAIARDAAKQLKANRCIVLYTNSKGQIGYASYGKTVHLCDQTRHIADHAYDAVMDWFKSHPLVKEPTP